MNFFEHQDAARRSSRRLIILFVLAVLGIVAAVDIVLLAALGRQHGPEAALGFGDWLRLNAAPLAAASLVTIAVIGIASLVRIGSLRSGGGAVAESLGGRRIDDAGDDPQLRRLRNVVEEIAIASSTPVPAIYVLEGEDAINAFAAGYSPSDAAIAVTRGALERLNRDELQGVIAHEFSHILNGDTRLNIRLMGVLFGILVLGIVGRKILLHGRGGRDSKNAGAVLAIGLGLLIIGYIGVFFGRLIKAGVSRSREYLADASAVQFTRQTNGIAGALKKIAGLDAGSKLANAEAEEVSHMLFGDGVGYSALWATHPPLIERIRRLDPQFDAAQLKSLRARWHAAPPSGLDEDVALGLVGGAHALPAAASDRRPGDPRTVAAGAGAVTAASLEQAAALLAELPPVLAEAARRSHSAPAAMLALLLDADGAVCRRQLELIAGVRGADDAALAQQLHGLLAEASPLLRLPLAELAFPALRRLPRAELDALVALAGQLIDVDGEVALFEYCLARLLQKQVVEALDPSKHRPNGRRKLAGARREVIDLLAVLAAHGECSPADAQRAFTAGLYEALPREHADYRPPTDWAGALDRALAALDGLDPFGKELLVRALAAVVIADGRVTVGESELLRTVCACLHCPLPVLAGR